MSRGWSDIVCASEGTVAWVEWWVKLAFFTKFQSQSIPTHMWRIFKVLCSTAEKRLFLLGGRFFKQTLAYNIIVTKRPRNILHWCNLVATVEVQNATKTYIYIYTKVSSLKFDCKLDQESGSAFSMNFCKSELGLKCTI